MNIPKVGSAATALSLLILWACTTEIHIRLSSRIPTSAGQPAGPQEQAKEPISLAELTERQTQREGKIQTGLVTTLCDSQERLKDEVRPHNQETTNWCWATSAQTVLEYHKEIKGQCDWVNGALSRSDCCGRRDFDTFLNRWFTTTSSDCDQSGMPHYVFDTSGFDYERLMAPGSSNPNDWTAYFKVLKKQICLNGPFISVTLFPDGGGHTQVVSNIDINNQVVEVNDHRDADFNTQPFDVFIGDALDDHSGEYGYAQEFFYVEISRL